MKKERALFPTILILVIAMFTGFVLLARVYVFFPVVRGIATLVLMAISFFLLRFALVFDRQMRAIQERKSKEQDS